MFDDLRNLEVADLAGASTLLGGPGALHGGLSLIRPRTTVVRTVKVLEHLTFL